MKRSELAAGSRVWWKKGIAVEILGPDDESGYWARDASGAKHRVAAVSLAPITGQHAKEVAYQDRIGPRVKEIRQKYDLDVSLIGVSITLEDLLALIGSLEQQAA